MTRLPAPAAVVTGLLSAADIAARLGLPVETVVARAEAGKIRGYRAGNMWGFREAEVRALLNPTEVT